MPVYIIRAGETDMVKIGWAASDVPGRCRELQAGCWERLLVLRTMDGDRFTEGWMHRQFRSSRIARDWFRFASDMMTVEPPEIEAIGHRHAPAIDVFGGARQLAAAIGVKPELAIHWRKRGIPAKFWPLVEATETARRHGLTTQVLCGIA